MTDRSAAFIRRPTISIKWKYFAKHIICNAAKINKRHAYKYPCQIGWSSLRKSINKLEI